MAWTQLRIFLSFLPNGKETDNNLAVLAQSLIFDDKTSTNSLAVMPSAVFHKNRLYYISSRQRPNNDRICNVSSGSHPRPQPHPPTHHTHTHTLATHTHPPTTHTHNTHTHSQHTHTNMQTHTHTPPALFNFKVLAISDPCDIHTPPGSNNILQPS